jgi:hypothetical protein
MGGTMDNTRDHEEIRIAIQALWLQYNGMTIDSSRTGYRIENAAWKTSPPPMPEDLGEISGLMVAT